MSTPNAPSAANERAEPAETCKHCGAELPPKPAGVGGRCRLFCAGVADKCKVLVPVPRAVVVVEGGIVQSVMTRTPLNVDVLDHDDFENCGSWRTRDFVHAPDCPDHDGGEVAEYVALAREADALPIDAMTSADAEVPAVRSQPHHGDRLMEHACGGRQPYLAHDEGLRAYAQQRVAISRETLGTLVALARNSALECGEDGDYPDDELVNALREGTAVLEGTTASADTLLANIRQALRENEQ